MGGAIKDYDFGQHEFLSPDKLSFKGHFYVLKIKYTTIRRHFEYEGVK